MKLYLVRHGKAESKERNPNRPLTDEGVETARRLGAFLRKTGQIAVGSIQHSTKLRARQTAEILAESAGLGAPPTQVPNLEPLADVEELAGSLSRASTDLLLVGHLPHLNRLASRLVTGDAEGEAFSFAECGIVCLGRSPGGGDTSRDPKWSVFWMLDPNLVPA